MRLQNANAAEVLPLPLQHPWGLPSRQLPRTRLPDVVALRDFVANDLAALRLKSSSRLRDD